MTRSAASHSPAAEVSDRVIVALDVESADEDALSSMSA